jgi:predicted Zn finger-like uncharacterized protein
MSLVTTCPSCGTVFRIVREQLDASSGWVRCGHCMDVFDAKSQFSALELATNPSSDVLANSVANDGNLSFVMQAKQQAFWLSRSMRAALGVSSLLLVTLLLIQIISTRQGAINQTWPSAAPITQTLCQYVPCVTSGTRQIDAWLIDSSHFEKEGSNGFRLSVLLKNASTSRLLIPRIELTLLGSNDALLVRHVIAANADELQDETMAGGAERTMSFNISPKIDQAAGSVINARDIAGYRLVLFHP